jgi:DNA-binding CsgD family transcriptional regulator
VIFLSTMTGGLMPTRRGTDGPSSDGSALVMEIARIVAASGGVVERAEALLEPLRRVVPFDASFIGLLHPDRREHLSLVQNGYDDRTRTYLGSTEVMADVELLGLQRERPPMRLCDSPVPPQEMRSWAEYLAPAGFGEGIGAGLFTADGRYLGAVGLHTQSPVPVTDAARDLLGTLTPLIAHAVDPLRSVSVVAHAVVDAIAGVVVTHAGSALPLPGLPGHPHLVAGSAVLTAAAEQRVDRRVYATFLAPAATRPDPGGFLRVTAMAAPPDPPCQFAAVVMVSSPGDLHGLTRRELEVLGLLVEGWPNQAMAIELGITERTVAAHMEHILGKLFVTSRTAAAIAALRLGLFVPRLLHGGALSDDDAEQ